jgi:hypothetical protein
VQLFYFGGPLVSSLLRIWAKSREVRPHTGIIVMERSKRLETLVVTKYEHAPVHLRPVGIDLPVPTHLCGCKEDSFEWREVFVDNRFGERFSFLRSKCCKMELHVAVFLGPRQILNMHGTTIVKEIWNPSAEAFLFDRSRMFTIRASVGHFTPLRSSLDEAAIHQRSRRKEERDRCANHDQPWTRAGREAQAQLS